MATTIRTLYQRFTDLGRKFDEAVESGDVAKAKGIKEEMEKVTELIELAREAKGLKPQMPEGNGGVGVVLPGAGSGVMPQNSDGEKETDPALAMYFRSQYGEIEKETDRILRQLYGADYQKTLLAHRRAWNKYLAVGKDALSLEEQRLLRQMVLTPEQVKHEVMAGKDISSIKATMVESVDPLGGYIVPADFRAELIKRLAGMTVIRGRARTWTTQRDRVEFPVATGGDDQYTGAVRVTWVSEQTDETKHTTNATFGMKAVDVHTVMASIPVSQNMLEDAVFAVDSLLAGLFGEASAIDEDNQFILGDGVGKPEGILPGGSNSLSLTEAKSGSASALTWDGLLDTIFALPSQYRQNAAWLANRTTWGEVAKLKDTSGQYLWQATAYRGGEANVPRQLLGFPVLEQEVMPDVAANAYPIIFGDFRGYYVVDRTGVSIKRIGDATSEMKGIVYFVLRRRLGGRVIEPWRFVAHKVAA